MHKCLEIYHIQLRIFNYIIQPRWDWSVTLRKWDRLTLANLAITCHVFHETAMNVLWSHLDDLSPLVRCMPQDVWHIQDLSDIMQLSWPSGRYILVSGFCDELVVVELSTYCLSIIRSLSSENRLQTIGSRFGRTRFACSR